MMITTLNINNICLSQDEDNYLEINYSKVKNESDYLFNGHSILETDKVSLNIGEYILIVDEKYPLGFLLNEKSSIEITKDKDYDNKYKIYHEYALGRWITHYYGKIKIKVINNFNEITLLWYDKEKKIPFEDRYNDGKYSITFSDKCPITTSVPTTSLPLTTSLSKMTNNNPKASNEFENIPIINAIFRIKIIYEGKDLTLLDESSRLFLIKSVETVILTLFELTKRSLLVILKHDEIIIKSIQINSKKKTEIQTIFDNDPNCVIKYLNNLLKENIYLYESLIYLTSDKIIFKPILTFENKIMPNPLIGTRCLIFNHQNNQYALFNHIHRESSIDLIMNLIKDLYELDFVYNNDELEIILNYISNKITPIELDKVFKDIDEYEFKKEITTFILPNPTEQSMTLDNNTHKDYLNNSGWRLTKTNNLAYILDSVSEVFHPVLGNIDYSYYYLFKVVEDLTDINEIYVNQFKLKPTTTVALFAKNSYTSTHDCYWEPIDLDYYTALCNQQ